MSKKVRIIISFACFVFAVCLIAAGIITHEVEDVFQKAVKICLECIGIG